jgi:uncharacterized delta-60 repeat protein
MKNHFFTLLLIVCACSGIGTVQAQAPDSVVVAWGDNTFGQTTVPVAARTGVRAVVAGGSHTVALKTNGSVVAWGYNEFGQATVPVAAQSGVMAIGAGAVHTLALKTNGSVLAWGRNDQGQTPVPVAAQSGVMAIAAGAYHNLALKTNGSVVAWGYNVFGQATVPVAAQSGVTAVAAGFNHSAVLKTNGSVVAWGNEFGQAPVPAAAQSGVVAIAAGGNHTLALKDDGSVVAWGDNSYGQTTVPVTAQSGVAALAAGWEHTVALMTNGTVVAWGHDSYSQSTVPDAGRSGVTAIAAGGYYTVALLSPTRLQLAAADYSLTENGGAVSLAVQRRGDLTGTHTVDYATQDGSAAAGVDYAAQSGTLTFAPGQATQTVSILILNDGLIESDETFQVRLSNLTGSQALFGFPATNSVTLLDNDTGFQFTAAKYSVWETGGVATITVLRGDDLNSAATVDYATSDGTATAGADYTPRSGTLHFAAGEINQTIFIPVFDDGLDEGAETVHLTLTNPSAGVSLGARRDSLLSILDVPPPAQGAVPEAWVQRYNNVVNDADDQAFKVVRDAAGDFIIAGTTDDGSSGLDMLTIKYSGADGSVLWQRRYNGPGYGEDSPKALAVDSSGNVLVTGNSLGSEISIDYYTAKYAAADGALLWEKRYNSPENGFDEASALAVDSNGNVVVTGSSSGTNGSYDYYTVKYTAADGAPLWEKRYNGPANNSDFATAVAVDGSGSVVVTGYSYNTNFNTDYYTARYAAADGALLWEKRYNGPGNNSDYANAAAVDGSGNVLVTGASIGSAGGFDFYTAKYAAANGALLWERRYNGPANNDDEARALAVDNSGNVVVTGYSYGTNPNFSTDFYTAKYAAANGALLWEKRYNGSGNYNDAATAVAVDSSGNVVVTGYSYSTNFNIYSLDFYTAKYAAANGALLWEKRYTNASGSAVVVDGSGNVVVTGYSYGGPNRGDCYTVKYAATDGALLWEQSYSGPVNYNDYARAVAVDGSGNVVVTGISHGRFGTYGTLIEGDYRTAKYAAASGALLWEQRYPNGGAAALALDGSGNVAVTGSSSNGSNDDYYTAKYAAANGALLWEKRYNGSGNGNDAATAIAVDSAGNVIVTGSAFRTNINYNTDYYTAKYAAADGALLWEKLYDGPTNSHDRATAVAVDSSGNVVVTGVSDARFSGFNSLFGGSYYTAKYAAADGALLWEKRYQGPGNSANYATAVVVDSAGNVVVTGFSSSGGGFFNFNYDYYTAKYATADGALLWEKRYNANDSSFYPAVALAVDGGGNVVVTGSSYRTNSSSDYYTAKYAAADGALLWEKRYNGLFNGSDQANAVAVDASGNVVVTGTSYNGTNSDYYTAKYAAADGALLWEQRYNGPANGDDSMALSFFHPTFVFTVPSSSLALGPNGMVAVTGSSDGNLGPSISYDFATVVYWENLPPLSVALVPTGVRLRFTGVPGRSYSIERAPAVTGPWTRLATPTAPASGLLEYIDGTSSADCVFYRTTQP